MGMMKIEKPLCTLDAHDKLWLESLKAVRSEFYEEVESELRDDNLTEIVEYLKRHRESSKEGSSP